MIIGASSKKAGRNVCWLETDVSVWWVADILAWLLLLARTANVDLGFRELLAYEALLPMLEPSLSKKNGTKSRLASMTGATKGCPNSWGTFFSGKRRYYKLWFIARKNKCILTVQRSSGSDEKQHCRKSWMSGLAWEGMGGVALRDPTWYIADSGSSNCAQGCLAVSISMIVHPSAQTSAGLPWSMPFITSGAIKRMVPLKEGDMSTTLQRDLEQPKSASLQQPSVSTKTFEPLMSLNGKLEQFWWWGGIEEKQLPVHNICGVKKVEPK